MIPMRAYQHLTDEALLTLYQQSRNPDLLGVALQRHTTFFLGIAFKYLNNRAAAEDAVQHIFLQALTHLPSEPITNFKGWLYVMLRNHCFTLLKKQRHYEPVDQLSSIESEAEFLEQDYWLKEMKLNKMVSLMQQLSIEQRRCLEHFFWHNKSYQEIVLLTGYELNQIKSYIQNGKRKLRLLLIKHKLGSS